MVTEILSSVASSVMRNGTLQRHALSVSASHGRCCYTNTNTKTRTNSNNTN